MGKAGGIYKRKGTLMSVVDGTVRGEDETKKVADDGGIH